jgi:hypothetical protein
MSILATGQLGCPDGTVDDSDNSAAIFGFSEVKPSMINAAYNAKEDIYAQFVFQQIRCPQPQKKCICLPVC